MRQIDDDDVLTMTTWITLAIAMPNPKDLKEALEFIDDLLQRFGETPYLCELRASALMQSAKFGEALKALKQARGLARQMQLGISSAVLVNSLVCLQYLSGTNQVPKGDEI